MNARSCGDCKACCWAPEVASVTKPGEWCKNCDIGKTLGCSIYEDRPQQCADFSCLYIKQPNIVPEHLSPWKARIMVTATDPKSLMVWELLTGAASHRRVKKWIEQCKANGLSVVVADPRSGKGIDV